MSTVFGVAEKQYAVAYDDDDDPILDQLRILDYRYMRFSFHPLKDRFILSNSWKDPSWTDVKAIRAGIDSEEKESRELVFGKNLIDIKQKTIPQLLVDEVTLRYFIASLLGTDLDRPFIHSMCSRLPVSCSGL